MKILFILTSLIVTAQASSEDLRYSIKTGGNTAVVKFFDANVGMVLSGDEATTALDEAFQKHDPRIVNLVLNHIADDKIFEEAVKMAYRKMDLWFLSLIPEDHSIDRISLIFATLKALNTVDSLAYLEDLKSRFE